MMHEGIHLTGIYISEQNLLNTLYNKSVTLEIGMELMYHLLSATLVSMQSCLQYQGIFFKYDGMYNNTQNSFQISIIFLNYLRNDCFLSQNIVSNIKLYI